MTLRGLGTLLAETAVHTLIAFVVMAAFACIVHGCAQGMGQPERFSVVTPIEGAR